MKRLHQIVFGMLLALSSHTTIFSDQDSLSVPLGLPPIPWPENNAYSEKKAKLGALLYFDKRLSSDGTVSCATCHTLHDAFTDHLPVSTGILGRKGTRNAPTVINAAYLTHLFWDGRAMTLEEQCKGPIGNPKEMTLAPNVHEAHQQCADRVQKIPGYRLLFKEAFGNDGCSIDDLANAVATFERTVLSGNSAYDKYVAGDKTALTEEQILGMRVYKKAQCVNCHNGPNFTDGRFLNIGVGMDAKEPDLGRYSITHEEKDWGAFKVPTLREIENTYPYMHDGSLKTLEEVIEYYDRGGTPSKNLHHLMKPLHLTDVEKKALLSFLNALSGQGWQHFTSPTSFPE